MKNITKLSKAHSNVQLPQSVMERWILADQRNEGIYHQVNDVLTYRAVPLENINLYFPAGYVPKFTFQHQGVTYSAISEIIDDSKDGCHSAVEGDNCGCDLCEQRYSNSV